LNLFVFQARVHLNSLKIRCPQCPSLKTRRKRSPSGKGISLFSKFAQTSPRYAAPKFWYLPPCPSGSTCDLSRVFHPQCVISAPDARTGGSQNKQGLAVDSETGDIRVFNNQGTSIIFDSFSPEAAVVQRNPVVNSISKINDPLRQFLVNFNVSVTGTASVVLAPSSVAAYCTSDKRDGEGGGCDGPQIPVNKPVVSLPMKRTSDSVVAYPPIDFDMEIERRKRQCSLLFGDLTTASDQIETDMHPPSPTSSWSPPSVPSSPVASREIESSGRAASARNKPPDTFAAALLKNLNPKPLPVRYTPFSEIRAQFAQSSSSPTPSSSYETVTVCSIPKRDLISLPSLHTQLHNRSDEMLAISTLTDLMLRRH
jgi:hypothetical protein